MRNNYKIILRTRGQILNHYEFNFYCTRTMIDKVFYSLAFALPSSADLIEVILDIVTADGIKLLNRAQKMRCF